MCSWFFSLLTRTFSEYLLSDSSISKVPDKTQLDYEKEPSKKCPEPIGNNIFKITAIAQFPFAGGACKNKTVELYT